MASMALAFDILARDRASRTLRNVGDEADKTGTRARKMGDLLRGALATAGVAVGASAVVGGFKRVVTSASDVTESVNAVNVSFGDAAAGVLRLSENSATAVGLSKSQFNGLAVQFSGFASNIAGSGGDVAGTIESITGRAADFASVMNLDVAEAARLFQSGLAGETEPLRKFGIDLSAAAVQAFAVEKGISAAGQEMTEQEKVQARYALLMESTAVAAGDFANTSDNLANRQRVLGAKLEDLAAQVGTHLLPVMERIAGVIVDKVVPAIGRFVDDAASGRGVIGEVVDVVGDLTRFLYNQRDILVPLTAVVGGAVVAFSAVVAAKKAWSAITTILAAKQALLNAALIANPIGIVIAIIAALVAAIVIAYKRSDTFREIVDRAWQGIRDAVSVAWTDYIQPALRALSEFVTGTLIPVVQMLWQRYIQPAFRGIGAAIKGAWDFVIYPILQLWWAYITNILIPIVRFLWENVISPIFRFIGSLIKFTWNNIIQPALRAWWDFITNVLIPVVRFLWERVIGPAFRRIGDRIRETWEKYVKPALGAIRDLINDTKTKVESARDIWDKFFSKLRNFKLPGWVEKLKDFVDGLKGVAGSALGRVLDAIGDADGDFRGTVIGGSGSGHTLSRIRSLLPGSGLRITSAYRSPEHNRRVGGSPTSLHMDRNNPAVDIAGPFSAMDRFARRLAEIGGWRQLLWKVAGHWDHIHVAHRGGTVSRSWPTVPGLRSDERPVIAQVGERIIPNGGGGGGDTYVINGIEISASEIPQELVDFLLTLRRRARMVTG